LFDLLTSEEDRDHESRFNMPLLAERLVHATECSVPKSRGSRLVTSGRRREQRRP
jgi:hypothetical protein